MDADCIHGNVWYECKTCELYDQLLESLTHAVLPHTPECLPLDRLPSPLWRCTCVCPACGMTGGPGPTPGSLSGCPTCGYCE